MAETYLDARAAGDVEAVYARIATRIISVLILLFVMAWMDRVNVGFARLQMQMLSDLGFSEAVFGFGAGIFYLGYLLFEFPPWKNGRKGSLSLLSKLGETG